MNRLGEAGDLARNIIIHDEGGLYVDNDVQIHTWKGDEWLQTFDAIYFRDLPMYLDKPDELKYTFDNSEFMIASCVYFSKPQHPI